ncbi:hypothetical protein BCR42DRAFT_412064 [Absidia repens]|uniref:Uncharacterized protein n=1 Tax=Absidia repens TaxID=90262 RepID=A0A1X2IMN0_9FUNG|nr:hypothetical protein BCR42DRAFT_412064 [Absidia repens]
MLKSLFTLYLVLCWFSLYCFCDDTPEDKALEEANKELGIDCTSMSTTVVKDAEYLLKNVLSKDATVKVNDGFFIVKYGTAAAVTRPSSDKQKTTTHAHLRQGIEAIMSHCKPDDGKIFGSYDFKDPKIYRICLTDSEETDDC